MNFSYSVTVIKRGKEIDIAAGNIRIVIFIHEQGGKKFLWPVLRQQPSDANVTGILGGWKGWFCLYVFISDEYVESVFASMQLCRLMEKYVFVLVLCSFKCQCFSFITLCLSSVCPVLKPKIYVEVQQTPTTKLKINNQEIDVTRYNLLWIISWYKRAVSNSLIIITLIKIYEHLTLSFVDLILLTTV